MAPKLTPVEVLDILIARMETRANTLEAVRLPAYDMAVLELRQFAKQLAKARDYVKENSE